MSSSSSTRDTVLVSGGAGYIGSHVVRQLCEAGEQVVVLDDLSTGFRSAVPEGLLVTGNTGDRDLVTALLAGHKVTTILHFAAHTIVPESVSDPLKYYGNNTCATRNLLECAVHAGVRNFIFSSTAAVYGIPANGIAAAGCGLLFAMAWRMGAAIRDKPFFLPFTVLTVATIAWPLVDFAAGTVDQER